jgi:hypothetical protein
MNKRLLSSTIALVLAISGVGCHKPDKLNTPSVSPTPAGPVELKLKWAVGERVVQDLDMKQKATMNLPGQPAPIEQDMTLGQKFALTVLKADPAGGHELEMEFLSARMQMGMGGKDMLNYDSTQKSSSGATNPMASVFGKLVGSKMRFFLDASNRVEHVEGMDELVSRLSSGGQAAAGADLKGMFNEGYFKQMTGSTLFLPSKPVQPGDTWPVQLELPLGDFSIMTLDYAVTFQSWEMRGKRNCARLEFQGSIKTKPGQNPGQLGVAITIPDSNSAGVSWFDPELGIIIETTVNQDMTMVTSLPMNLRGNQGAASRMQTITNQMSQVFTTKLDSLQ